jgi:hypothetical protein
LVKNQGWLIGSVDTHQKIGKVEFTNFSRLEESLSNFRNHFSVENFIGIFFLGSFWNNIFRCSGQLEDRAHEVPKVGIFTFSVRFHSLFEVCLDRDTIHQEIFFKHFKVLSWVSCNVVRWIKLLKFERWWVNRFAFWDSLSKLLNTSNGCDHSSNGILRAFFLVGSLELLDSNVKHKERFIFISNAFKKIKKIKFTSKGFKNSLLNLG